MTADDLIRAGRLHPAQPWPRRVLTPEAWSAMAAALGGQPHLRFQALWADAAQVFALFTSPEPLLVSAPVEAGLYAALSPHRPAAAWFERAVTDLWGHQAAHAVDARPWLDHGAWPVLRPMLPRPTPNAGAPDAPEVPPAPGAGLRRFTLGPLGPGLAEPGQATVIAAGETVARLELRFGFAHRGIPALMRGKTPRAAARLAGRVSGADTVAHATAFAQAVEAAVGTRPPPRAAALRAVMAELERVATLLADAEACLAAAGSPGAGLDRPREAVLRASGAAFGHRLLMDAVVPGGVAADLGRDGEAAIRAALDVVAASLPAARRGWGAGARGRMRGTGLVPPGSPFQPPPRSGGDVLARLDRCLDEAVHAAVLLRTLLPAVPPGETEAALPPETGEGLGRVDGPHGPVWHWVQMERGAIAAAFARDPAWVLWPLVEAAAQGAALADLPMIAASFGASAAGADL